MSMGTPGWNPGADAMRAQQEANRLQQESTRRMTDDANRIAQQNARLGWANARPRRTSPGGRVARLFGILVVLAVVAGMVVFGILEFNQHSNLPDPGGNPACPVGVPDCTP